MILDVGLISIAHVLMNNEMGNTGIEITNMRQLQGLFEKLETTDNSTSSAIKRVLKGPFLDMKRKSKSNLRQQGSIRTGKLYRSLSVSTRFSKRTGKYKVAFGAKGAPHFHLINTGTIPRKTKSGYNRGSVGRARTNYRGRNTRYSIGFADRAIKSVIPTIENTYVTGLSKVYDDIMLVNPT